MLRLAAIATVGTSAFLISVAANGKSNPEACNPFYTRLVSIEDVQANFDKWNGKCVRLRGIRMTNRIHSSREALFERVENYDDEPKHSIVVNDRSARHGHGQAHWIEVTGRIGSCRVEHEFTDMLNARNDGSIYMTVGYCHTSMANYIKPDSVNVLGGGRVKRLTEAEVPFSSRDLVEVPTDVIVPTSHKEAARQLLTAIVNRDKQKYLQLTRPYVANELRDVKADEPPQWLREEMSEASAELRSPALASLRSAASSSLQVQRVFIDPIELDDARGKDARPATRLTFCWCKSEDCRGRWPVFKFDADNDPSRSYFCVWTNDYLLGPGKGGAVQAQAKPEHEGLGEPNWAALEKSRGPKFAQD